MGEEYNYYDKVYELNPYDFQDINDEDDESNLLRYVRFITIQIEQDFVGWETTKLTVVRYALTQPKETQDWKRTVISYTYIKYGDKGCKIIIDSGSCINTVSSSSISHLGLKFIPHTKICRTLSERGFMLGSLFYEKGSCHLVLWSLENLIGLSKILR